MKKRTLKMLLLITVISSLFVGCSSKKTATTQTVETQSIKNTSTQSTQATQSTEATKSTELTTAESTENTEATKQTEQATEELIANNNYSAEPATVYEPQPIIEANQSNNDNAQNDTSSKDSAPVQQPEPTIPAPTPEPEQPAQANNCPYPLLTVTTYKGYTGYFFTKSQVGTDAYFAAFNQACQAVGAGNNGSMHVGTYDDTGDVYFCSVWK